MTVSETLADFVVSTDRSTLSRAGLLAEMPPYLLDLTAVAIAGSEEESALAALSAMADLYRGPNVMVFGHGKALPPPAAALVNGTIAHGLEFDDDHRTATVHPGAVVIPAALAVAELEEARGDELLRAILLGYEVMCRIGEAFGGRQFYKGFHPTGTCGVFGSVTAAGVLLGLDRAGFTRAYGIAGTQASGLGEWRADGAWTKRLHAGKAAEAGILAAFLARNGFTGPRTILEGEQGFLHAFSGDILNVEPIVARLGDEYRALETAFKPYPCCRFAHGAIDLALDLYREGVDAREIRRADVRIFRTDTLLVDGYPQSAVEAQFHVPYLISAALLRGKIGLEEFGDSVLRSPDIQRLAQLVTVTTEDDFTRRYPTEYPIDIRIATHNGGIITSHSQLPTGDPGHGRYESRHEFAEAIGRKAEGLLIGTGYGEFLGSLIVAIDALTEERSTTEALFNVLSKARRVAKTSSIPGGSDR